MDNKFENIKNESSGVLNNLILTDIEKKIKADVLGLKHYSLIETYLKSYINEIDFKINFNYRPEYVSYELYKTNVFSSLILYINNCKNKREFNSNKLKRIKIINEDGIKKLSTLL